MVMRMIMWVTEEAHQIVVGIAELLRQLMICDYWQRLNDMRWHQACPVLNATWRSKGADLHSTVHRMENTGPC